MIIEGNDSPRDEDSHFEEVELGQTTIFEGEAQDEPAVPEEAAIEGDEEARRPDSQESDEQQEYLNNLCGKEIL